MLNAADLTQQRWCVCRRGGIFSNIEASGEHTHMLIRHLHAERNSVCVCVCVCVCAGESTSRSASLFSAVHQSVSLLRGLGARRESVRSQDWSRSLDQWSNFVFFFLLLLKMPVHSALVLQRTKSACTKAVCVCVCVCVCVPTQPRGFHIFILGTRHVEETHVMQIVLDNCRFLESVTLL